MRLRIFALVLAVALAPFYLGSAEGKFSVSTYTTDVFVATDGSARVVETVICVFEGAYDTMRWSIMQGDHALGDSLSVYFDGEPLRRVDGSPMREGEFSYVVDDDGGNIDVEARIPDGNISRVFRCEYELVDVSKRFRDTALIDHVFIGGGHTQVLHNVIISINLPGMGDGEIHAFTDIADAGDSIHVQGGSRKVNYGPFTLASGQPVRATVLFPGDVLTDARVIPEDVRAEILAREAERNIKRPAANSVQVLLNMLLIAYAAAVALMCLISVHKYGLRGKRKITPEAALADDCPAAFAYALENGTVDMRCVSAALNELTEKGVVRAVAKKKGYRFEGAGTVDGLMPHQQLLTARLFEKSREHGTLEDDASGDIVKTKDNMELLNEFSSAVYRDLTDAGYYYRNDVIITAMALFLMLGGITLGIALCVRGMVGQGTMTFGAMLMGMHTLTRVRIMTDAGERLSAALGICAQDIAAGGEK